MLVLVLVLVLVLALVLVLVLARLPRLAQVFQPRVLMCLATVKMC